MVGVLVLVGVRVIVCVLVGVLELVGVLVAVNVGVEVVVPVLVGVSWHVRSYLQETVDANINPPPSFRRVCIRAQIDQARTAESFPELTYRSSIVVHSLEPRTLWKAR